MLQNYTALKRYQIENPTLEASAYIGCILGLNSSGDVTLGAEFGAGVVVSTEQALGSKLLNLDVALFGSGCMVECQLDASSAVTTSTAYLYSSTGGKWSTTAPEVTVTDGAFTSTAVLSVRPVATAAAGSLVSCVI